MTVRHLGNGLYYALSSDTKPTTSINGAVLFETNTRKIYFFNGSIWEEQDATPPASGEANTMSNIGTGGIGIYKQKTSVNFELKTLEEGATSTISLTDDTTDNEIEIDVNAANLSLSNIGGTLTAGQLPTGTLINTADNNLGDHYLDIGDIAAPSNPSAGIRRLFTDTATGELSVRTSAGTTVSLEGAGSGEVNTASNIGTGGVGLFKDKSTYDLRFKKINAGSSKITITDDTGNDEVDIDIGAGTIVDASIGAHTTTKITTTDKSLLNSNIMYEDEDNNIGTHYLNVGEIAAPTTPSANNARLYIDSTSNNLTIKKDSGSVRDLELKQYPVLLISHISNSSANWADGRSAPFQTTRWNGKNNTTYITTEHELVITRFRARTVSNSKDGTTTFIVLDDDVAVPNTTLNISALTNTTVDSGAITQTIASGSQLSFKSDTSASTTGNIWFTFELWGYWNKT